MPKSISSPSSVSSFSFDQVQHLLAFVTSAEICTAGIAERRQKFLTIFAEMIQADLGLWSWGRGYSTDTGIQPVAMIDYGMTSAHKAVLADIALARANDLEFRALVIPLMDSDRRATLIRRDVYSEAAWKRMPSFRRLCDGLGMSSWVMAIRYPRPDTWCNMSFWRKADQEELGIKERELLELAINSISWLLPTAAESLPSEAFTGLTPRQRGVLTLLLDGMSRKAVAANLGVTEHTVGDHIKSIYQHFKVHSLSELVAQLLKAG